MGKYIEVVENQGSIRGKLHIWNGEIVTGFKLEDSIWMHDLKKNNNNNKYFPAVASERA